MSHYYSLSLSSYDFGNVTAYSEYDNYEYKAGAASANARPIIKKNEEDDASNESAADARAPNRNASSGSGNGENYYDDCDEYDGEMYSALSFLLDDEAAAAAAAANGGNIRAHHRHLSSLTVSVSRICLSVSLSVTNLYRYTNELLIVAPLAVCLWRRSTPNQCNLTRTDTACTPEAKLAIPQKRSSRHHRPLGPCTLVE